MSRNGMTRLLFRDPEQDHVHLCLGTDTYAELKTKHNCWNHTMKEKTKQQPKKEKKKEKLKNNTHTQIKKPLINLKHKMCSKAFFIWTGYTDL